jgi:Fe-S-cluster containining protein
MGDLHTPKVCVRCFRLWKRCIQDGEEDLPNCIFLNSSRSKKCRYSSQRRSVCVPVSQPVFLRSGRHDSSRIKILMPLMRGENGLLMAREFPYEGAMQAIREVFWEASHYLEQFPNPQDVRTLSQRRDIYRKEACRVEISSRSQDPVF